MEQKIMKNKATNESSIVDQIKEPHIKEIFLIIVSNKILNPAKIHLGEDIEASIKQETKESINDKLQDMNEIFSELRKSGIDLGVLNFKMMMLPLKIKMFLSTYEKKDLEILLKKIQEIEVEINTVLVPKK